MITRLPEYTAWTSASGAKQAVRHGRPAGPGPAPGTRHPPFVTTTKYLCLAENATRLPNLSLEMEVFDAMAGGTGRPEVIS